MSVVQGGRRGFQSFLLFFLYIPITRLRVNLSYQQYILATVIKPLYITLLYITHNTIALFLPILVFILIHLAALQDLDTQRKNKTTHRGQRQTRMYTHHPQTLSKIFWFKHSSVSSCSSTSLTCNKAEKTRSRSLDQQ